MTHHFDEWWDRVGMEFKIKLFVSVLLVVGVGGGLGFYFWLQQYEKKELLEMAQSRQAREAPTEKKTLGLNSNQKSPSGGGWNPRED
jgi:hypothetical protein